ncbi:LLM class F420-dependent oxidoreductase [Herbidospora cretacea]|uniref:LLM class F420-dependent oxidoreductase n=1 Tax=Herbidospora cretacea TaxID=28444 RepID=UPI0004C38B13|nr:LLM class F420-dependent oxidoreductase [Herbidospora cretacea]
MRISAVVGMWLDSPAEEALSTALLADRAGYEELWIGEVCTWDAFALAAAVGIRTTRIALTVGPLAVAVRGPAGIAMGAASVAALTGRRVGVALGTSSTTVVERWHGRSRARPGLSLEETARAIRPLLAGERGSFDGELVRTDGFRLRLPPPGGPLTVAAFGPRAVATAARHADRMAVNMVSAAQAAALRTLLDAASPGPRPALAAWLPAAVDPRPETYAQLARGFVPYLSAPGYAEMFAAAGFADLVALARGGAPLKEVLKAVPRELAETVALVGDVPTIRDRIAEYAAAGVDEIAIFPATSGDPGGERTLRALRP